MSVPLLRVEGLIKRFGGLTAVDGVSLDLNLGELHAVIGPNGAGKTTLASMIAGETVPSAGRIVFAGRDVAGLPAHRLSRLGFSRSYQKTNIFMPATVFENCRLAAQSRDPRAWQIFSDARRLRGVNEAARRALDLAGLGERQGELAAHLSHGEQRQLEIAMCLATAPRVLLLDEPLAGMGAVESARMVELVRALTTDHAIMLIEHDMDAVFTLAQRLTVMVDGAVVASGEPSQVRADPKVQSAYLGHDEAGHG